ncbi:MAG TPA: hypothetical protein VL551_28985 [Actinospica sp.]|nr:hypothetical protein [Actinospica sp.]
MSEDLRELETRRIQLQDALDAERSSQERNEAGQFATPAALANEIARYALQLHEQSGVSFLEPSCGTGSFFSALLNQLVDHRIECAVGVEFDQRFAKAADSLWGGKGLRVMHADFTNCAIGDPAVSLLLANPPYVRHHHLSATQKKALGEAVAKQVGLRPSGLSGLYLYFVLLSHRHLAPGAISAWLIPSEFMDVNYGLSLKRYLTENVSLLRIHRYDPAEAQFSDALVTSAVVVFKNEPPTDEHMAEFTFGGSLPSPRVVHRIDASSIDPATKWSRYIQGTSDAARGSAGRVLSDFFKIRRGLATGSNTFFILERADAEKMGISDGFIKPVLPSPRGLKLDVIEADQSGWPVLPSQLALIDCPEPIERLRESNPELAGYLGSADEKIKTGYLVSRRTPWYKQESRDPAPILLTYMGRGKGEKHPLRFILNHSRAVATNVYLMLYPTPLLQKYLDTEPDGLARVHKALLSMSADDIRDGGRVYGGGLHKMEPKELAALPAAAIVNLAPELFATDGGQLAFF